MKILITGSTGFLGRLLTRAVCETHQVTVVVRDIKKAGIEFGNSVKYIDASSSKIIEEIRNSDSDIVFHLAGNSNFNESQDVLNQLIDDNIKFGTLLLQGLIDTNLKLFVNFSSSLSFSENEKKPTNFYATSKLAFSEIINYFQSKLNFKVVDLVLYTVYGKGDTTKRVINYVFDSLDTSEPILMSPGDQQLDFIHCDDVIKLCVLIIDLFDNFESYTRVHVGTGKSTTIRQLAKIVESVMDKKTNITWGGIPYRKSEKIVNVAPTHLNTFWKASIQLEEGISLIK